MLIDSFIEYIRAEKRFSENTALNYRRDLRRFFSDMNIPETKFDPSLITADDIRKWIVKLSESGLGAASVNRMTSSLRSFYRWLRKTEKVKNDPFVRINTLRKPKRLPGYVAEAKMVEIVEDIELTSKHNPDSLQNALIITLFYSTGIRLAELLDIRLGDFSDGFRDLRIRGKGDKERIVPLVEYARAKISEYVERINSENAWNSPDNYLFLNSDGRPLSRSYVYRVVRDELTRMGVQGKRSPHILRHTFATHLLNGGADIREIQEILGHSSLMATQVYTHNSISQLKDAYRGAHPRGGRKK